MSNYSNIIHHNRKSVNSAFSVSGIGIHSGNPCTVTVKPSAFGSGIAFYRMDVDSPQAIAAVSQNLRADKLSRQTTIGNEYGQSVATIEHLMAALYCYGITDCIVETTAQEMPIFDGSALQWSQQIEKVGVATSDTEEVAVFSPDRPFGFRCDDAEYSVIPSRELRVTYFFKSTWRQHPTLSATFLITPRTFHSEIASARTFCFFHEIEMAVKMGMIRGGSLSNAVVIGRKSVINPGGLRFDDEPLRHKVLDFLGDISLLGRPLSGHFMISRGGHKTNAAFLTKLIEEFS